MKKSLSTRLMYSFMTIIIIVVVGITAGISYLIADYFFQIKEQELAEKGDEMGETIEAFIRLQDRDMLYRYILAVDKLVGARIWLFDDNYELLAASSFESVKETGENANMKEFLRYGAPSRQVLQESVRKLDQDMKSSNLSYRIKVILNDVYAGKSFKSQIYHPYYKEQVILVGVPYTFGNGHTGAILMIEPLSGFEKFLRNVYIYIMIVGIIAIIFSLFLVKRLSGLIIRPVLDMKDNAQAMASGDYSRRLEVHGDDEIAELEQKLAALKEEQAQITSDFVRLQELSEQIETVSGALDAKEERWIELQEMAELENS